MTEKLYYRDSHLFAFTAKALACREGKKGWEVVLDQTAFFPEGGGQPADPGMIEGIPVLDVQEEADDESDDFVSGIGKHRWIESLRNAVHELVGLGRFKREMSELRKEDVENGITFRLAAEICARHFERPDAEWTNPIVRALSPEPTEED